MKNLKIALYIILGIGLGLVSGWFLFTQSTNSHDHSAEDQMDNQVSVESQTSSAEIYTCSMHPQIRQNEPGLCPICEMDLIPANSNQSDDPLVLQMTESAVKLANIQTTIVGEEENRSDKVVPLSGKIQTDERLASSQVAHVPGRIEKLYVTFTGENVKKGQKIATIYSPDLINAQRELLEALKLVDLNPNLLEAARNKLRFWKISNSSIEAIESNGVVQETFTVFADESGIVTQRRVTVGDYIKQGEPLFDLMDLSKVWVLFDAYEEDLASIKVGNSITFTTPSLPNKTFKTRVTFIDPIINPNTRVTSIRTEVNNPGGRLKPEMFVQGVLQKKSSNQSQITVPKSAVLWTGTRSVVYVKVQDATIPSFKFKEVELGESMGTSYAINSGLEPGEEVVTYGSFTIDAAAQLNNQTSMMNKDVKIKGMDMGSFLPDYTLSTPDEFKAQLIGLADAYLLLKDALAATDSEQASSTAKEMMKTLSQVDMTLISGDAHMYWMKQLEALQSHGAKITELTDVEEQRRQFDFFSQALITSIKVFGINSDTLYVQHCPMANDNAGADWISSEAAIRNPYFGDKMMKCGTVKDTITKDFKNPAMTQVSNVRPQGHNH